MILNLLCKNSGQRLVSLREVEIVVAAFLFEYVVAVVVVYDLVEVTVLADADNAGLAVFIVVAVDDAGVSAVVVHIDG